MTQITSTQQPSEAEETHGGRRWVTTIVWLVLIGMVGLFVVDRLYNPDKFQIEEIEVRGKFRNVNGERVKDSVIRVLQGNYFSTSLDQVESAIRLLPWVFDVSVRRQWPSTLVVDVEEVQPIAEWGESQWLNASGDLVAREPWDQKLPALSGPTSMQETVWKMFQQWHGMFASHGLSLDRLQFDERELWYLTLSLTALAMDRNALKLIGDEPSPLSSTILASGGEAELHQDYLAEVTMIVDNADATPRITRLINALNSQLIAEFPSMKSIDLRYPNGFAIDWIKRSPSTQTLTESK